MRRICRPTRMSRRVSRALLLCGLREKPEPHSALIWRPAYDKPGEPSNTHGAGASTLTALAAAPGQALDGWTGALGGSRNSFPSRVAVRSLSCCDKTFSHEIAGQVPYRTVPYRTAEVKI